MQSDLAINDLVVVETPGTRLKHQGRVINRFTRSQELYAVQFDDGCIGFFERRELGKITPQEATTHL